MARACSIAIFVLLSSLLGCNGAQTGTRTGNPDLPDGVELVSSALERDPSPDVSDEQLTQFGMDNQGFAFDLYAQAVSESDGDNLFISPYSVSVAMAMTYAGAENDTEREIAEALHFALPEPALHAAFNATDYALQSRAEPQPVGGMDDTEDGLQLSLTNATFVQQDFELKPPFLDVLAVNYGAGIYTLDFEVAPEDARQAINGWVEDRTEDRIVDLLPEASITEDVRVVLVNAIYFKASWEFPFDEANTEQGVFHAPAGDVDAQLMHARMEASYAEGDGYAAVVLPYVPAELGMLIVLPDAERFDAIEAGMSSAWLADVLTQAAAHDTTVTLPRFSFSSSLALKDALSALGMPGAFTADADLTGMVDADLFIDQVYHQAFVAVDEKGTEAAAATAVVAGHDAAPPPAEIVLDRPFLFLIYDRPTGQILFLGRLTDPS